MSFAPFRTRNAGSTPWFRARLCTGRAAVNLIRIACLAALFLATAILVPVLPNGLHAQMDQTAQSKAEDVAAPNPVERPLAAFPLPAPPSTPRPQEVVVPSTTLPRLLQGEWIPLPYEDYRRLADSLKVSTSGPSLTRFTSSTFTATFTGQDLRDGEWRAEVRRQGSSPVLHRLTPLSFGIDALRWDDSPAVYGSDSRGETLLLVDAASKVLAGRWSQRGRRLPKGVEFAFQAPSATATSLRLKVPQGLVVKSTTGFVRQLSEPRVSRSAPPIPMTPANPTGSPGPAAATGGPSTTAISTAVPPRPLWNLWEIDLGSQNQSRVSILAEGRASELGPLVLVDADAAHVVRQDGVQFQVRFHLDVYESAIDKLVFSAPLEAEIFDVNYGGDLPLRWTTTRGKAAQEVSVVLPDPLRGRSRPIRVQGIMPRPGPARFPLPFVTLKNSILSQGQIVVRIENPMQLVDYSMEGCRQTDTVHDPFRGQTLTFQQFMSDAQLIVDTTAPRPVLTSRAMQHIVAGHDSWNLSAEIALAATTGQTFSVRLTAPLDWDVLDVRVRGREGREEPASWSLVTRKKPQDREIHLEFGDSLTADRPRTVVISARRPAPNGARPMPPPIFQVMRCASVFNLLGISTPAGMSVALDPPSNFELAFDADIPEEIRRLPLWGEFQKGGEGRALFSSRSVEAPRGRLRLQQDRAGRFDAQTEISVEVLDRMLKESFSLEITPQSVMAESLLVYLSHDGPAPHWELADAGGTLHGARLPKSAHAPWNLPESGELWEIQLPRQRRSKFRLTGSRSRDLGASGMATLVFLPASASQSGRIHLKGAVPARYVVDPEGLRPAVTPPPNPAKIEATPGSSAAQGTTSSVMTEVPGTKSADGDQSTAKKSPEVATGTGLSHSANEDVRQWSYRSLTDHLAFLAAGTVQGAESRRAALLSLRSIIVGDGEGHDVHRARYLLARESSPLPFRFQLPEDSSLISVLVNEKSAVPIQDGAEWTLPPLPEFQVNVVEIAFRSPSKKVDTWEHLAVQLPTVGFSVLRCRWDFALPDYVRLVNVTAEMAVDRPGPRLAWTERVFGPLGRTHVLENSRSRRASKSSNPGGDIGNARELVALPTTVSFSANTSPRKERGEFPAGWTVYSASTESPTTDFSLTLCREGELRAVSWAGLLGCLFLGCLMRMFRWQSRMRLGGVALALFGIGAWFAPDVFAIVFGGCFAGTLFAVLIPRRLLLPPRKKNLTDIDQIASGSTATFRLPPSPTVTAVTALLLMTLTAWSLGDVSRRGVDAPFDETRHILDNRHETSRQGLDDVLEASRPCGDDVPGQSAVPIRFVSDRGNVSDGVNRVDRRRRALALQAWRRQRARLQSPDFLLASRFQPTATSAQETAGSAATTSLPPTEAASPSSKLASGQSNPSKGPFPEGANRVYVPAVGQGKSPAVVYLQRSYLKSLQDASERRGAGTPWLITSAAYSGTVDAAGTVDLDARFQIVILGGSQNPVRVRIPLSGASLIGDNGCLVDGRSVPIFLAPDGKSFELEFPAHPSQVPVRGGPSTHQVLLRLQGNAPGIPISQFPLSIPRVANSSLVWAFATQPAFLHCEGGVGSVVSRPENRSLVAALGDVDMFNVHWSDQPISSAGLPALEAKITGLVDVSPSLLRYEMKASYRVLKGAADYVVWQLPASAIVQSVTSSAPITWNVNRSKEVSKLIVEFPNPRTDAVVLSVSFVLPVLSGAPDKIAVRGGNFLSAEGTESLVVTHNHLGVHAASEYLLKAVPPLDRPGATAISAETFLRHDPLAADLRRPQYAYHLSKDAILEFSARPQISRRKVRLFQTGIVQREYLLWKIVAEVQTTDAPAYRHTLSLDPRLSLDRVSVEEDKAERLVRWSIDGRKLTLLLSDETQGTQTITLAGTMSLLSGAPVLLPEFSITDSELLESRLVLVRATDVSVKMTSTAGEATLEPESSPTTTLPTGREVPVGRYLLPNPAKPPSIVVERRVEQRTGDISTTLSRSAAGKWSLSTTLRYRPTLVPPPGYAFVVPRELVPYYQIQATGVEPRAVPRSDGAVEVTLIPKTPSRQEFLVTITATLTAQSQGSWELPSIVPLEARVVDNFLSIAPAGALVPLGNQIRSVASTEIPAWGQGGDNSGGSRSSHVSSLPKWTVKTPTDPALQSKLTVSLASTTVRLASDGTQNGRTEFFISHGTGETIEVDFPEGLKPSAAVVDGIVTPLERNEAGRFPLVLRDIRRLHVMVIFWKRSPSAGWNILRRWTAQMPRIVEHEPAETHLAIVPESEHAAVPGQAFDKVDSIDYDLGRLEILLSLVREDSQDFREVPLLWPSVIRLRNSLRERIESAAAGKPEKGRMVPSPRQIERIDELSNEIDSLGRSFPRNSGSGAERSREFIANIPLGELTPAPAGDVIRTNSDRLVAGSPFHLWFFERTAVSILTALLALAITIPICRRIPWLHVGNWLHAHPVASYLALAAIWWLWLEPREVSLLFLACIFWTLMKRRGVHPAEHPAGATSTTSPRPA